MAFLFSCSVAFENGFAGCRNTSSSIGQPVVGIDGPISVRPLQLPVFCIRRGGSGPGGRTGGGSGAGGASSISR